MNKKVWLLFVLFPFYIHSSSSSSFTDLLAGVIIFGQNLLASEMFSEAGDHYGPIDKPISKPSSEEKRKRIVTAAEKRRDEEKKAQESLKAYLKKQTEEYKQRAEYV